MNLNRSISARRAFTLLEATISIVVLSVIAAACLPVINAMADNTVAAERTRHASESVAFAMERTVRLIRDCPSTALGGVGISIATPTQIRLTDGRGVRLDGTNLLIEDSPTDSAVLARDVSTLQLTYLASDGLTNASATPTLIDRVGIRIVVDTFELRCAAFPRVRMVTP